MQIHSNATVHGVLLLLLLLFRRPKEFLIESKLHPAEELNRVRDFLTVKSRSDPPTRAIWKAKKIKTEGILAKDSFKQPDFGSKGLGPAYRSLMTFGQADDLDYEFATNSIATPGRPTQHWVEVCLSRLLMRSLRVGFATGIPAPGLMLGCREAS